MKQIQYIKVKLLSIILFFLGLSWTQGQTVKDIDGNYYRIVTIGSQTWMGENLKTTKLNDGSTIPWVTDSESWSNQNTPAYCWYNNDKATYKSTYGGLYNWYAVNTGKLCPAGWHVPSDAEWTVLTDYLGGEGLAGGMLKEAGLAHWFDPNASATNETGYTALPGGYRYFDGTFNLMGYTGFWWSSTAEYTSYDARYRCIYHTNSGVYRTFFSKLNGFSIRCLRDQ